MKDIFLLDVDDTLLDFRRGEREQLLETLSCMGIAADGAAAARFHEINDSLWKALERGEIARERLVVRRFEILFSELNAECDPHTAAAHYFRGMASRAYALEGAVGFLRALSERGRVYAVTNGSSAIQRSRMQKAGIAGFFSDAFLSEEAGVNKPSPLYAQYVAAHIPCFSAKRAVWVGDSLTSDMPCAAHMGVEFILYSPTGTPSGYCGRCAGNYAQALAEIDAM